jgi:hypothetical protein
VKESSTIIMNVTPSPWSRSGSSHEDLSYACRKARTHQRVFVDIWVGIPAEDDGCYLALDSVTYQASCQAHKSLAKSIVHGHCSGLCARTSLHTICLAIRGRQFRNDNTVTITIARYVVMIQSPHNGYTPPPPVNLCPIT